MSGSSGESAPMRISIIVPVYNEAALIRLFLAHLRERAPEAEIIVADGGSTDGTDQLATGLCDQVVRTGERSRARQMNVGAWAAGGDIFWFLHADATAPLGCLDEMQACCSECDAAITECFAGELHLSMLADFPRCL